MRHTALPAALAALAVLAPAAAALPPGPHLTTGAADQVTDTSARVVVYVNGNAQGTDIPSQCWIDYGTTLAYGARTDVDCAGTAYETLSGLTPDTTYYYQLGGSNSDGTGHSPTYKSFTTLGAPPPGGTPPPPPTKGELPVLHVTDKQRIGTAIRRGVRLRLGLFTACSPSCTVKGELRVSKKAARLLQLSSTRLGRVKRHGLDEDSAVTVRLYSSAARRLRHAKRTVHVTVSVSVSDAQGPVATLERKLKLRR